MSDNTDFVAEARQKCAMSIRSTAHPMRLASDVGDWLGDALRRLEESDAENERLRNANENFAARFYCGNCACNGCDRARERRRQAEGGNDE